MEIAHSTSLADARGRLHSRAYRRIVSWAVVAALGVIVAFQLVYGILLTEYAPAWVGSDYRLYMTATERWLEHGMFYSPYQLLGPYQVRATEILYPPVLLWLLVPYTILPALLWWAVPVGVTLGLVASYRPGPWRIASMLALLALPIEFGTSYSLSSIVSGNPVIWVVMSVALATRFPAFGPVALVKFTLAPFAMVGIRRRAWWIGLGLLVALSLPFGLMWADYITVLSQAQTEGPASLYSLKQFPLVAIPLIASIRLPVDRHWLSGADREAKLPR